MIVQLPVLQPTCCQRRQAADVPGALGVRVRLDTVPLPEECIDIVDSCVESHDHDPLVRRGLKPQAYAMPHQRPSKVSIADGGLDVLDCLGLHRAARAPRWRACAGTTCSGTRVANVCGFSTWRVK